MTATPESSNRWGLAAGLASAMILAGCLQSGGGPREPADGPGLQHVHAMRGAEMTLFKPGTEGLVLHVYQTNADIERAKDTCLLLQRSVLHHVQHFWVVVWNRTQLVYYHEEPVNYSSADPAVDFNLTLPSADPPFLVWAGHDCISVDGWMDFEARPDQFLTTSSDIGARREDSPMHPLLVERAVDWNGTVTVPAGSLEGVGAFRLAGTQFLIEDGLNAGLVRQDAGQRYGDFYAYEPNVPPIGDDWFMHTWWHLGDDGWKPGHFFTGRQGNYALRARLDAPYPADTTWTAGAQTWRFTPRIAEYGFQYPFQDVGVEEMGRA